MIAAVLIAKATWISKFPLRVAPSNCHCQATNPLAMVKGMLTAAPKRLKYATEANIGCFRHSAMISKIALEMKSAIGK